MTDTYCQTDEFLNLSDADRARVLDWIAGYDDDLHSCVTVCEEDFA